MYDEVARRLNWNDLGRLPWIWIDLQLNLAASGKMKTLSPTPETTTLKPQAGFCFVCGSCFGEICNQVLDEFCKEFIQRYTRAYIHTYIHTYMHTYSRGFRVEGLGWFC